MNRSRSTGDWLRRISKRVHQSEPAPAPVPSPTSTLYPQNEERNGANLGSTLRELCRVGGVSYLDLPDEFAPGRLLVPTRIAATAKYLLKHGPDTESLFRTSGSAKVVEALEEHFNRQTKFTNEPIDRIHSTVLGPSLPTDIIFDVQEVASLFKKIIRQIFGGILGSVGAFNSLANVYNVLSRDIGKDIQSSPNANRAVCQMNAALRILSDDHRCLTFAVFGLLASIRSLRETTNGTQRQVVDSFGMLFAPLLLGYDDETEENKRLGVLFHFSSKKNEPYNLQSQLECLNLRCRVVELLITFWPRIVEMNKQNNNHQYFDFSLRSEANHEGDSGVLHREIQRNLCSKVYPVILPHEALGSHPAKKVARQASLISMLLPDDHPDSSKNTITGHEEQSMASSKPATLAASVPYMGLPSSKRISTPERVSSRCHQCRQLHTKRFPSLVSTCEQIAKSHETEHPSFQPGLPTKRAETAPTGHQLKEVLIKMPTSQQFSGYDSSYHQLIEASKPNVFSRALILDQQNLMRNCSEAQDQSQDLNLDANCVKIQQRGYSSSEDSPGEYIVADKSLMQRRARETRTVNENTDPKCSIKLALPPSQASLPIRLEHYHGHCHGAAKANMPKSQIRLRNSMRGLGGPETSRSGLHLGPRQQRFSLRQSRSANLLHNPQFFSEESRCIVPIENSTFLVDATLEQTPAVSIVSTSTETSHHPSTLSKFRSKSMISLLSSSKKPRETIAKYSSPVMVSKRRVDRNRRAEDGVPPSLLHQEEQPFKAAVKASGFEQVVKKRPPEITQIKHEIKGSLVSSPVPGESTVRQHTRCVPSSRQLVTDHHKYLYSGTSGNAEKYMGEIEEQVNYWRNRALKAEALLSQMNCEWRGKTTRKDRA